MSEIENKIEEEILTAGDELQEVVEIPEIDYSVLSIDELYEKVKDLGKADMESVTGDIFRLRSSFENKFEEAKDEALQKFLDDDGKVDDFEYRPDEISQKILTLSSALIDKVKLHQREQQENQKNNLYKRQNILNVLREIVDNPVDNDSFTKVKSIQEEWKEIGNVPAKEARELWSNYKALLDRFYNNRSIFFDLLELDRKKNLEAKSAICERAEEFINADSIFTAVKELHKLHDEYKNIGPVPKEENENVWLRFKNASDAIYDKRNAKLEEHKLSLEANKVIKNELILEVTTFETYNSDSIKEWNVKTEEVLKLQERWKKIGAVPDEDSKEFSKSFWKSSKIFFNNKRDFFKQLDEQRDTNLAKKVALCEEVEGLVDNDNFEQTAETIKTLQGKWKTIGQVPKKHNEEVFQRFRAACDAFFNNRRDQRKATEEEFEVNLTQKEALCEELVGLDSSGIERFKEIADEWTKIGFVPRKAIKKISEKYEKATATFIGKLGDIDPQEKAKLMLTIEMGAVINTPNAELVINRKRTQIRGQINELKNDIDRLQTNIQFFAKSKKVDALKLDVENKVKAAENEIDKLKEQLKLLKEYQK